MPGVPDFEEFKEKEVGFEQMRDYTPSAPHDVQKSIEEFEESMDSKKRGPLTWG